MAKRWRYRCNDVSLSLQTYKDELSTIKNDLDQVRKLGFQIMERVPEEKRTGVERRVEEVVHEHRELEKKVRTKEEVSACAVSTTGLRADKGSPLEANLCFRVGWKISENVLLLSEWPRVRKCIYDVNALKPLREKLVYTGKQGKTEIIYFHWSLYII